MKAFKTLLLAGAALMLADFSYGQTWTQTSAPVTNWDCLASSADGTKLIAGTYSGWRYYISTNSGSTWTTNTEPQINSFTYGAWRSVAISANGSEFAGMSFNTVWVSTNSGISWTSNNIPTTTTLSTVVMSADGRTLLAGMNPGGIYVSTNFGAAWVQTSAPSNSWTSIACSASGNIFAGVSLTTPTSVYVSTNTGFIWTRANTNSPASNIWHSVTLSADGTMLVAGSVPNLLFDASYNLVGVIPGLIYTSTNLGVTWSSCNVPGTNSAWQTIASSADGKTLLAGMNTGGVYVSTNFGVTWASVANLTSNVWVSVASSADGNKLVAVSSAANNGNDTGGGIYTWQAVPSPRLSFASSATNLTVVWTTPSTNFGLQQSADLTTWSDVTNMPVLNLSNLQNQVTLPPSGSSAFYRLKTP